MRNTKKEIAKVTARMSSRILIMAQTVLNAKKAAEMVKTKLNSELSFRALETEYKAWAFWFDATSMHDGLGIVISAISRLQLQRQHQLQEQTGNFM